jgi:hypothetical protein
VTSNRPPGRSGRGCGRPTSTMDVPGNQISLAGPDSEDSGNSARHRPGQLRASGGDAVESRRPHWRERLEGVAAAEPGSSPVTLTYRPRRGRPETTPSLLNFSLNVVSAILPIRD